VPVIWVIAGLVVIGAFGFGYLQGYGSGRDKLDDDLGQQLVEAVRIVTVRGAVTEKVVTKHIKVKGDTETVTRTVEKEIPVYASHNTGLSLDGAWRVLHDAGAFNTGPDPATVPYGQGGAAPTAATALGTVTANYAACHRTADRLDALQEWVREQGAVR
jgi:hypothetical protein